MATMFSPRRRAASRRTCSRPSSESFTFVVPARRSSAVRTVAPCLTRKIRACIVRSNIVTAPTGPRGIAPSVSKRLHPLSGLRKGNNKNGGCSLLLLLLIMILLLILIPFPCLREDQEQDHDQEQEEKQDGLWTRPFQLPRGSSSGSAASFQVLVEKIENRFISANLVRFLRKTMALVVEDDVLNYAIFLLDGINDLVRLRLDNARIIGAL